MDSFLINSDYPLDKVIYLGTHQVTLSSFQIQEVTPAHTLGFTPLLMGQWSTTPDFSVAYGINAGPSVGMNRAFDTSIAANNSNLWIQTQNRTGSTATVYYRMFGFVPSDINPEASYTSIDGDDFVFNTEYNYMKLLNADMQNVANNGSIIYDHNLGYYPKVMVWNYNSFADGIMPHFVNRINFNMDVRVSMSNTTLQIDNYTGSTIPIHYRVYIDEA